jgi:hypothetical protein
MHPVECILEVCHSAKFFTTQGMFTSVHTIILEDLCLPEFSFLRRFKQVKAFIFNAPNCPYDILLDRKFMRRAKMKLDFHASHTTWLGSVIPFHPRNFFKDKSKLHLILEHESVHSNNAGSCSTTHVLIKDAIYDIHDPIKVAAQQIHLSKAQCKELATVFKKCSVLFSGHIGCSTKRKFCIKLKPGMIPFHCKCPYHISQHDVPAYKKEMLRQESIGALEHVWETAWGLPGFVRPKKDGTI